MAENNTSTFPVVANITVSDISGLWEVIRICDGYNKVKYPWLGERFKFNFLDEMIYFCCKDGNPCHGTWELSEKTCNGKKQLFLILDDKVAYEIINVFSDEMTLSDGKCEYYLVRRL